MALKVELKPNERIIIGACVVTNTDQRARLLIDGDRIPILREKDIMTADRADTPAKRIYLAIQLMYLSQDPTHQHEVYFQLVRDFLQAAPSSLPQAQAYFLKMSPFSSAAGSAPARSFSDWMSHSMNSPSTGEAWFLVHTAAGMPSTARRSSVSSTVSFGRILCSTALLQPGQCFLTRCPRRSALRS
jgi:flagellar biosynthesis regulator FlbT